jgi:uncharacterized membrane protein
MTFKILLILHMIGLSIGAGTGIYIAAVGRHAARNLEQAEARTLIPGVNGAISKIGTIGLALLLASGLGLAIVMGPAALGTAFWVKMALVALLVVYLGVVHRLAARTRNGDLSAVATLKSIGPVGPTLALLTIVSAVVAFS